MTQWHTGRLRRPWLWLPSKLSHDLAPYVLPLIANKTKKKQDHWRSLEWKGLTFKNPLGIAGGVDKTGHLIQPWSRLGAGFVEVGTVTPEPQGPNPGRIMDRDLSRGALWNKMGFPNPGLHALKKKLQDLGPLDVPIFVNIGKNRWTENDLAHQDYSTCLKELAELASVFVVNVSSPNTKGLRDLLSENHLKTFLEPLAKNHRQFCPNTPILLKLSPDMGAKELESALEVSSSYVDGWILTNTTQQRYPNCPFPSDTGGVSGAPLSELSLQALKVASRVKKDHADKIIISVGGVNTAQEILERLQLGADLVQVYSALVFEGPHYFAKRLTELHSLES